MLPKGQESQRNPSFVNQTKARVHEKNRNPFENLSLGLRGESWPSGPDGIMLAIISSIATINKPRRAPANDPAVTASLQLF